MNEPINNQTSIMFTDMVGYSKMIGHNQDMALRILDEHNNIIMRQVDK